MRQKRAVRRHRYALIGYDPGSVEEALEMFRTEFEDVKRSIASEEEAFEAERRRRAERNERIREALIAALAEERRLIDE
ncbi:hypothetical protein [Cohnella sp. REN36]|uniref:hypothetical protein n=1 Tax=Cohnella sp. REN36 TaxID=2887347 RepID=UPI001D140C7E|nr:hypothetical protein [Cohnella sp. REN36]MCC3375094.1 hypothetical protein [Cohnella sp. REN36]